MIIWTEILLLTGLVRANNPGDSAVLQVDLDKRANERPWMMQQMSSQFVQQAVQYRSPDVPPNEASSIASRVVQGALSPPQVTKLFDAISQAFIEEGTEISPQKALELVQLATKVYGEVKTSVGFDNYLKYVSVNAKHFNVNAILQGSNNGMTLQSMLQSQLHRLEMSAQGREAVYVARNLVHEVERDAGILPSITSLHQTRNNPHATGRPVYGHPEPYGNPRPNIPQPRPGYPGPYNARPAPQAQPSYQIGQGGHPRPLPH